MTEKQEAARIYNIFYKIISKVTDADSIEDMQRIAKEAALAAIDFAARQQSNSEYGVNLIREEIADSY